MLILTRKHKERIDIVINGRKVGSVTVLRITGSTVRIGLAGESVDFKRGELTDRRLAESVSSGSGGVDS